MHQRIARGGQCQEGMGIATGIGMHALGAAAEGPVNFRSREPAVERQAEHLAVALLGRQRPRLRPAAAKFRRGQRVQHVADDTKPSPRHHAGHPVLGIGGGVADGGLRLRRGMAQVGFPGGGGNWGGSFLTVPAQGEHPEEAKALAAWLTAPEQQVKAFISKGTFPSQVETYEQDALLSATNAYFNDAPVGEILVNRSEAIGVAPFKSVKYFPINDAMQKALTRVDSDKTHTIESSWEQFVADVTSLG